MNMARRKIYAKKLLKEFDFYHLAREFYLYITRYPELEADSEWKELKQTAENIIVEIRCNNPYREKLDPVDYRDFLRFYTKLEMRFYDEERKFIFTDKEKQFVLNLGRLKSSR